MRKSSAAPPPPRFTNGNSSTSMSEDSDSTSGESLEGLIELSVMLPNGKCVRMSTEKRTPMMDLLVQVTKANGLSPGSFVLDVKSERSRDSIRYKPNTAVGSLNTSVVYVVAKSSIRDVSLVRKDTKTGNIPFEKTFRLRVHLPRNQLHVLRVSQTTPLIDVFSAICTERELNSSRYELRHPVHTEERLDPQRCLADYGLSEVAIVAVKGNSNGFSRSSSDIMSLQHDDDRKKHRFFGFMFKKSKSVSRSIGDTSSDGHSSRGVSPARSDGSGCQSISPPPPNAGFPAVITVSNNNNNNKASKKRAAPPPPKPVPPKETIEVTTLAPNQNGNELTATSSHSRHSSDSSGYHEASILSDSMDTTGHDNEHLSDSKASHTTAKKVQAPSNLTTVNSTSMVSVSSGPKKRKAPAPPARSVSTTLISNGQNEQPVTPPLDLEKNAASRIKDDTHSDENKPFNGKTVRRKDSVSSHASSTTSEEIRLLSTPPRKAQAPVPLPRQTKSPAPMPSHLILNEEKQTDSEESESVVQPAINGLESAVKSSSDSDQAQERHPSFGEKTRKNSDVVEAFSELHGVNLSTENGRRISSSSTVSTASSRKSAVSEVMSEKRVDHVSQPNSTAESETKSVSRLISVASYDGTDTAASSRRRSVLSEVSSHSTAVSEVSNKRISQVTTDEGDNEQKSNGIGELDQSDGLKKRQEVSVQTNFDEDDDKLDSRHSSISSFNNGEKETSGGSSRKSSYSQSEGGNREDLVQPESPEIKQDDADNITFAVAPLELSSLDENRNSAVTSDAPLLDDMSEHHSNAETMCDQGNVENQRISSDSSNSASPQSSPKSRKPGAVELEQQQHRVKEADVTALSAQIDKSMSEHRIAAEIDEAFASIDSMETGSDSADDKVEVCETTNFSAQSTTAEAEPVITWEYRIPEVPAQFQNDYDDIQDAQLDQESDETVLPSPAVELEVSEIPLSIVDVPPLVKDDVIEQQTLTTKMDKPKSNGKEVQESIYKRPVMSFSISTYKSRVEEESEYGRKLVKEEPPPTPTRPSAAIEQPSLPRTAAQAKPRVADSTPGHSLSISKALTKPVEAKVEFPSLSNVPRKDNSEIPRSQPLPAPTPAGGALGSTPEEQEKLQQEYLKLHNQFLQWQQQLLQNQTVLQQQQILPESATETLQRIQELHQQFMSLPVAQQQKQHSKLESVSVPSGSAISSQKSGNFGQNSSDYPKKTNSLPRPKSAFTAPPAAAKGNADYCNSLERKQARVGPQPWIARPVSVSLGAWQSRNHPGTGTAFNNMSNSSEPTIIIESKTENKSAVSGSTYPAKQEEPQIRTASANPKNVENVPRPISIKERVSSFNATNSEKPVPVVSRQPSQPTFPRCPVVKGFASVEPVIQQKSKVLLNSAPKSNGNAVNGNDVVIRQKPGTVRVNSTPQNGTLQNGTPRNVKSVVNTYTYFGDRVDASAANKASTANGNHVTVGHNNRDDAGKITVNAMNHNNNINNKNFTTVVVNAAPARQQSSAAPPPPPPPPASLKPNHTKVSATVSNGQANRKSVSSPESEEDVRDELMLAIRGFGGRTGLKKVSSAETGWQTRHGNL